MHRPKEVGGDLEIRKDYYPWVDEQFLIRHERQAWLVSDGDIFLTYVAKQARQITFEPALHRDYVVYSEGPKVKRDGNYTRFTYPDGSVVADGRSKPDFRKLQALRLGGTK